MLFGYSQLGWFLLYFCYATATPIDADQKFSLWIYKMRNTPNAKHQLLNLWKQQQQHFFDIFVLASSSSLKYLYDIYIVSSKNVHQFFVFIFPVIFRLQRGESKKKNDEI